MSEETQTIKGTKIGVVTSDKRDQTRTVQVDFTVKHPKYGKYINRRQKFHVHDPENSSKAGDRVEIASCNPVSKTKSWKLLRIVEQGVEI